MDDLIKRDDALLPCPFCGGEASIHKGMVAFEDYEIHCDICGVCSPNFGALNETLTPQSDAIAAWNTRALPADPVVNAPEYLCTFPQCGCVAKGQWCPVPCTAIRKAALLDAGYDTPAIDPAAIREAAWVELAQIIRKWRNDVPMTGEECANAILALIGEKK